MQIIYQGTLGSAILCAKAKINCNKMTRAAFTDLNGKKINFLYSSNKKTDSIYVTIIKEDETQSSHYQKMIKKLFNDEIIEIFEEISEEWISSRLIQINDDKTSQKQKQEIIYEMYQEFRTRNDRWDDDNFSDILSYAEVGKLFDYITDLKEASKYLTEEINEYDKWVKAGW